MVRIRSVHNIILQSIIQQHKHFFILIRRAAKIDEASYNKKMVDNTYEARLKRLKEELNGPTVTEIIQMHKIQEKNQTFSVILEETPAQLQKNASSIPSNSNALDAHAQSFDRDR